MSTAYQPQVLNSSSQTRSPSCDHPGSHCHLLLFWPCLLLSGENSRLQRLSLNSLSSNTRTPTLTFLQAAVPDILYLLFNADPLISGQDPILCYTFLGPHTATDPSFPSCTLNFYLETGSSKNATTTLPLDSVLLGGCPQFQLPSCYSIHFSLIPPSSTH